MEDKLELCPCGGASGKTSNACYTQKINEKKEGYSCFGCGFQTSDLMKVGELDVTAFEETYPELYKDIKFIDKEGRIYYPQTINIPEKGIVFANGSSKEDWGWGAIKSVLVKDEEKEKFINPVTKEYIKYKNDSTTLKTFGKFDYIEALDYIGFFK